LPGEPDGGDGGVRGEARGLRLKPPFEVTSLGRTCHEVRDGGGEVFAWCPDRPRALVMAGLLEAAFGVALLDDTDVPGGVREGRRGENRGEGRVGTGAC
jgi:hypothetical protein